MRHPSYTGSAAVVLGGALALLASDGSYAAQLPAGLSLSLAPAEWHWGAWVRAAAWALAGWRVVATLWVLPRRAVREDEILGGEFGAEWEAYARRTPCRIIPYVW